ncbi:MAG: serine/threonine protein kinase [Gemmatimonadales bacterium]
MPETILIAGRYEVLRTLGQGAFGRTFLARDTVAGREVAIKMLDTQKVDSFKGFELFEREAAVLRSVRHHGVPEIYDSLRADWEGSPAAFLVMEYVAGKSLEALIAERHHLDPAEATHILLELLGVLDYLHGRVPPILHRDIKPANIILRPDGFPTLVDFGAVRSAIHAPGRDGSTIVGTYGYMPYEQHMGQATPSSDLYALAATFIHLLTGRAPPEFLNGEGRIAVPESLPGGDRLRQVLSKMLRLSPAERFQDARGVRQALVESESTSLAPASRPQPVSVRRHSVAIPELPPAPRPIEGETEALYRRLAPTALRMMAPNSPPAEPISPLLVLAMFAAGVASLGVMPIIYYGYSMTRRRRVRTFLKHGVPATAEILTIQDVKDSLGAKTCRIRYQWVVEGVLHRGADEVWASIAGRWLVGDQIQIMYLPDKDFDSLVISTG